MPRRQLSPHKLLQLAVLFLQAASDLEAEYDAKCLNALQVEEEDDIDEAELSARILEDDAQAMKGIGVVFLLASHRSRQAIVDRGPRGPYNMPKSKDSINLCSWLRHVPSMPTDYNEISDDDKRGEETESKPDIHSNKKKQLNGRLQTHY